MTRPHTLSTEYLSICFENKRLHKTTLLTVGKTSQNNNTGVEEARNSKHISGHFTRVVLISQLRAFLEIMNINFVLCTLYIGELFSWGGRGVLGSGHKSLAQTLNSKWKQQTSVTCPSNPVKFWLGVGMASNTNTIINTQGVLGSWAELCVYGGAFMWFMEFWLNILLVAPHPRSVPGVLDQPLLMLDSYLRRKFRTINDISWNTTSSVPLTGDSPFFVLGTIDTSSRLL